MPFRTLSWEDWSPAGDEIFVANENGETAFAIVPTDGSRATTIDLGVPVQVPMHRPGHPDQISFLGTEADGTGHGERAPLGASYAAFRVPAGRSLTPPLRDTRSHPAGGAKPFNRAAISFSPRLHRQPKGGRRGHAQSSASPASRCGGGGHGSACGLRDGLRSGGARRDRHAALSESSSGSGDGIAAAADVAMQRRGGRA